MAEGRPHFSNVVYQPKLRPSRPYEWLQSHTSNIKALRLINIKKEVKGKQFFFSFLVFLLNRSRENAMVQMTEKMQDFWRRVSRMS